MDRVIFEQLIKNPPKLHFWNDDWRVGGLNAPQLRMIERLVLSLGPSPHVLETGAGLSTLIFLALGARVTSFFTLEDLRVRIQQAAAERALPLEKWDFVMGFSENTVPRYLQNNRGLSCDLVLVDGGHMVHTAFVDFTYGYSALRQGGYILIDDLQMKSVQVLYRLLKASRFVEEVEVADKTAAFRKMSGNKLPGPWGDVEVREVEDTSPPPDNYRSPPG